jgi:hypothetical protein
LAKNTIERLATKSGSEFNEKYETIQEVMFDGRRLGVVEAMRLNGYGKYSKYILQLESRLPCNDRTASCMDYVVEV